MSKSTHKLLMVAFTFGMAACSSHRDRAEKVDTNLDNAQNVQGETIGLKDGNVVVQRKVALSEELRKLQRDVYEQEYELYGNPQGSKGLRESLKECYTTLSDPRIGGNGQIRPVEPVDRLLDKDADLKFGIDEKNALIGLSEEGLSSRIDKLQRYKAIYRDRLDDMKGRIDTCENDHRVALINHGFNPADTKAEGYWVTGKNGVRVWRAREKTTDDPEELARRKAEKEKE